MHAEARHALMSQVACSGIISTSFVGSGPETDGQNAQDASASGTQLFPWV